MSTFQQLILNLSQFWADQGCAIMQGYDLEVGAGTFNPSTFLRALGPEPYSAAYVEPSRRPTDGRYGDNPNRLQHYFQYQVALKPSPPNMQELYLRSLETVGLNLREHDIRFVHDDWESPTLGAWGLGWEVWSDGMEISQYTYFQAIGGIPTSPVTGELTIGLERLAMYLQKVDNVYDLRWNDTLTYGDIYHRSEVEWSQYNFEEATTEMWFRHFQDFEREAKGLLERDLPIPAYDFVIKASHAFNMLDARRYFSVTERAGYIARIRELACSAARAFIASRERLGFPLLKTATKPVTASHLAFPTQLKTFTAGAKGSFLLEIGSEEIPATFVPKGMQSLQRGIEQLLAKENIAFDRLEVYGTPRRLAVQLKNISMGRAAECTERRGPALTNAFDASGAPTKAAEGFFRSIGKVPLSLKDLETGKDQDLEIRELKGERYLFATVRSEGRATAEILAEALPKLIADLDFPKKMRWGSSEITYARPLCWIIALLNDQVIPFQVGDSVSGRTSRSHRQRCAGEFSLAHADAYLDTLRQHQVMADVSEREAEIKRQLSALESEMDAELLSHDKVIPQVLHLVEWPTLTYATFDERFLSVPKEVLISEMVEHQKYFPVANRDGSLRNLFVITADTQPTDAIRHGNKKVLSARLSDGAFLYNQDLKSSLEALNDKLRHITFQKDLGTIYEKVERLIKHARVLYELLPIGELKTLERAALLCKADLASHMVGEFPELQGVIGRYYALASGESPDVALAIEEHWMPRGDGAPLPISSCGTLLSLAEKIDNLLGCFAVGLKPTSSSDPYALRRQVLGIIRILIRGGYRLPLETVLSRCYDHFPKQYHANKAAILAEVLAFVTSRVKTVFLEYDVRKDEIEASLAQAVSDIYDIFQRVKALHDFRESNRQFSQLYEVFKRAKGQLDGQAVNTFQEKLLNEAAEVNLDKALRQIESPFHQAVQSQQYTEAYDMISHLQTPLAALFDQVKILADDPAIRQNRIALLDRVMTLFKQLLDFSKIQEL